MKKTNQRAKKSHGYLIINLTAAFYWKKKEASKLK